MKKRNAAMIIFALTLFTCFMALAEDEAPSVIILKDGEWAYPDAFEPQTVAHN